MFTDNDTEIVSRLLQYAAISRQYRDDALRVIRTRPAVYLESVTTAYLMYFRPDES